MDNAFWKQNKRKIIIGGICVILFAVIVIKNEKAPKETVVEEPQKELPAVAVDSIVFGEYRGTSDREVLATVESFGEVTLTAEVPGTIERVYVNIGDSVYRGQVLARYRRGDDQTFINYQNSLSSLEQSKLTTDNSIFQAEINLENAKVELERQKSLQVQSRIQSFEALKVSAITAETNMNTALDFADRIVRATNDFRTEIFNDSNRIGSNNVILKQNTKNKVLATKRAFTNLSQNFSTESTTLASSQARLNLLSDTQQILTDLDTLIRMTPVTKNFSSTIRSGFETQVDGYQTSIDSTVTSLTNQIQATKGETDQFALVISQAENRVKTAEANLDLAKGNATSSVKAAQNAVDLASSSISDLDIKAPFNGTVTEKMINDFQQVSPGNPVFTLVDKERDPKVVSFVTKEELQQLEGAESVEIVLDGSIYTVSNASKSTKVDPITQKIRVEYTLPKNTALVGSLGKLRIPSESVSSILLPLSSVSFEPTGAEVLVLVDGIAKRQQVVVGDIVSDGIEILEGIESGDVIIQFRSRVFNGQKVISNLEIKKEEENPSADAQDDVF